jgi:hypothetical protein
LRVEAGSGSRPLHVLKAELGFPDLATNLLDLLLEPQLGLAQMAWGD